MSAAQRASSRVDGFDRALVLTAGLGTRLRPLTGARAKAAVPVDGVPLVRRVIGWLVSSGVRDLVLNLHHKPESITAAVGDGSDLGARVRYSWESPILGSAGGPRHALPLLLGVRPGSDQGQTGVRPGSNQDRTTTPGSESDDIAEDHGSDPGRTPVEPRSDPALLLVNGDTLTDVDLGALAEQHARCGALVTMALIPNPRPDKYGGVLLDVDGSVTAFTRRGHPGPSYHFIGVQAVQASVLAPLPDGVPSESVLEIYPALMKERPGAVQGFVSNAAFQDIGTPADLLATSLELAARDGRPGRPAWGRHVRVARDARVERSLLWDDVSVGAGASLVECIVADEVAIPDGARYERCAIVRDERGALVIAKLE